MHHHNSSEVMTGNKEDVIKISRQILNRSTAQRTIPKQECMVELADLPLVLCSEQIETINLSGSYKLTSTTHRDLVTKYRKAAVRDHTLSLHDFVTAQLKQKGKGVTIIPHYVGANGQPKYPPTKEYARAVLLVHKPWANFSPPKLTDMQWLDEFNSFITSPDCPQSVALEYARVKERYLSKRPDEAIATEECYRDNSDLQSDFDEATRDILGIVTNNSAPTDPYFCVNDFHLDKGLNYNWSKRVLVSGNYNK